MIVFLHKLPIYQTSPFLAQKIAILEKKSMENLKNSSIVAVDDNDDDDGDDDDDVAADDSGNGGVDDNY